METEVHSSLRPNCHHQITYVKFDLKIHYQSPCEREIWHYDQTNVDHIRKAVDLFLWKKNIKISQHKQYVFLLNKMVKNMISNYNPHETVTFDDRDPLWINKNIKQLILEKNEMHKKYVNKKKDPRIFDKVKCLQNELNSIIESNKQKYYCRLSKKLVDPMTSTKSYWSSLKMLLKNKKIPCIPPLRYQNKHVTDFKEKVEIFNSFFAEQCSLINNSSRLPSKFLKRTVKFISSISFSSNNIARIIRDLGPNKAHGHNMISICMLKICGESISKPLEIIFKSCMEKEFRCERVS